MTTDLQTFDCAGLKSFYPATDEALLPNVNLRLSGNRRHVTKDARRLMVRLQKTRNCVATIQQLPAADESIHCVLNGEFALFDFLPAVLELSGQPCDELWIATLGFSKANVAALGELIDAGQVKSVCICCSTYFWGSDRPIYDMAAELCAKHGFRTPAPLRNHAKLLLIKTGAHHIVIESSANLRSCHNTETAVVLNDPALFDFHRQWLDEMLTKAGA